MEKTRIDHKLNPEKIMLDLINRTSEEYADPYTPVVIFYKGIVVDNKDPLNMGRIKVRVLYYDVGVPEGALEWFVPISSNSIFVLPSEGQLVFVTYEDSKNRIGPIWISSFIKENEWPVEVDDKKILIRKEEGNFIYLDYDNSLVKLFSNGTFIGNDQENLKDYLDSQLDELKNAISGIESSFNAHVHISASPGSAVSPPVTPMSISSLFSQIVQTLKQKIQRFLSSDGSV